MFQVNILKSDILPSSIDSSSFNEVKETDKNLDFQSIIQNIKERKDASVKHNGKNNEHKTNIEIDEEVNKYKEMVDEIIYLIGLLMEIEPKNEISWDNLENLDFNNVLMKLEESLQMFENMQNNTESIYLNVTEIKSLIDTVRQAKEILNEHNLKDYHFSKEIGDAIEEIEEKLTDILDLVDNSKGEIEKGKILITKEDINFGGENTQNNIGANVQLDHGIEDIGDVEGIQDEETIKKSEYNELMTDSIDFTNDTLMEDGTSQTTTDINYSFNFITKDISTADNSTDINIIQDFDREELIQQIVEKIEIKDGIDKQEVKIRLKPDYLGDLILKMEMKEGSIQAKIVVDNYRTKEIIESSLFQLKEQFEENGLNIKTFEVFVGANEDFEREKRNGYVFKKNQRKLKLGTKVEEVKTYDSNFVNQRGEIYEGKLNLFA